jgi:Skp family chaperone for outer membrane proteins
MTDAVEIALIKAISNAVIAVPGMAAAVIGIINLGKIGRVDKTVGSVQQNVDGNLTSVKEALAEQSREMKDLQARFLELLRESSKAQGVKEGKESVKNTQS